MSQETITGKFRMYFELNESLEQHTKIYEVQMKWSLEGDTFIRKRESPK